MLGLISMNIKNGDVSKDCTVKKRNLFALKEFKNISRQN